MKINGKLSNNSLELIGKANELSNKVSAILISKERKNVEELSKYGIDSIYHINKDIENYEIKSKIILDITKKYKPKIFLFPKTFYGKIISSFIASKLNTGLSADCIDLKIDKKNNKLVQKRVAYGGDLMADIICPNAYPQIATISPNVFKVNINADKNCEVIEIESEKNYITNVFAINKLEQNIEKIEEAKVIVAGGAGVKTKENFIKLNELSALLGGTVGATRNAVDMGLTSYQSQIGQSGIITNTDLYIACGISGAIEHLVGINSKTVIAINNDIKAPIFNNANYGIIGDLENTLDKIIKRLKER